MPESNITSAPSVQRTTAAIASNTGAIATSKNQSRDSLREQVHPPHSRVFGDYKWDGHSTFNFLTRTGFERRAFDAFSRNRIRTDLLSLITQRRRASTSGTRRGARVPCAPSRTTFPVLDRSPPASRTERDRTCSGIEE